MKLDSTLTHVQRMQAMKHDRRDHREHCAVSSGEMSNDNDGRITGPTSEKDQR